MDTSRHYRLCCANKLQRVRIFARSLALGSLVLACMACSGCASLAGLVLGSLSLGRPQAVMLPFVPAGASFVESNASSFRQQPDHPLLNVPAGTIMDALSGLNGCWAANESPRSLLDAAGEESRTSFLRINLATNELVYQLIVRGGAFLPFDESMELVYSIEAVELDRIIVRFISGTSSSTFSGESRVLESLAPADDGTRSVQITLDGDAFRIGDSLEATEFAGFDPSLVFLRLECP